MEPLLVVLIGAGVNGAVTWGVVKATLYFLREEVKEAKAIGNAAHRRIDDLMARRAA